MNVIRVFIGCTVMLFSANTHAGPDDVQAADDAASVFEQFAGDVDAIEQNLSQPLLSDTPMRATDGTTFDAQLTCQQEDAFMEVFIIPSATGDIGGINIQQDTTMDGVYDHLFTSPVHASGVCANGLISCSPGTWTDCTGYQWSADPSNKLGLNTVALSALGGCYCVNNHCGTGLLVNNLDTTVAALGGGAAAVLAANNPTYAITNTRMNGPSAEYFGQDTAQCDAPGLVAATDYYNGPNTLTSDATAASTTNSTYQLMAGSPVSNLSDLSAVSCDIRRNVGMDEIDLADIIDYNGGTGSVSSCGNDCLQLVLGQIGNDYWGPSVCETFTHEVEFNVLQPNRVLSATLERAVWDDWIQVRANGNLIWSGPYGWAGMGDPPGACELSTSWDQNPNVDFTTLLQAGGLVDFNIRVAVAGGGEGYVYAKVDVDTECELEPDVIHDGCQTFEANPQCTLISETVDDVDVLAGGLPTGLVPLPATKTINGVACSKDVTRPWWTKKKTYSCAPTAATTYDFSTALDRKAFVESSTTPTRYQDRITDTATGTTTFTTGELTLLDEVAVPACVSACKTRRERPRNDVGRSGVVSDLTIEATSNDILYHECGVSNVCPVGAGEVIVTDCGCLDGFRDASAIMQIIRMGGQDIICSSGVPQTFD